MPQVYRRVILKPSGLGDPDSSRLGEMLTTAVELQGHLSSKSAHVLQFVGGLQEVEGAFFVEHEPANALAIDGLFDSGAPGAEDQQLLRLTAALFDALRVAQMGDQQLPRVHGGLCPGVVLISPDGIEKITDFAFAPAICATLGVDSYLNLAVSPSTGGPADLRGSGVWEVLTPDEFERHDRICAFLDPEKYGTQMLDTFEPGSDVIAAAFILHLLAEHQHPYLFSHPDAHRLVEMSEFMGASRYNGARRQDLRESSEPAVRLWCELVAKALARLPAERPTASEVIDALGQYVRPVDAGEILRRRLDGAEDLVQQNEWNQVRSVVKAILGNDEAPADVAERASALLCRADANLLLIQATELLKGDHWCTARQPLDTLLALPALSADIAERAQKASGVLDHSLSVWQELERLDDRLGASESTDPAASQTFYEELLAGVNEVPPEDTLLPVVRTRRQTIHKGISDRLEQARAELQEAVEADHSQARDWLARLQTAHDGEDWQTAEVLLAERPELQYWPQDMLERVGPIEQRVEQVREEQRRQAAIEADHRKAEEWIAQLRQAQSAEQWERIEQLLKAEPDITHWPDGVREEARGFAERASLRRERDADFQQARSWCDGLWQAVERENWTAGADLLARRPALEHWPEDVRDRESLCRKEIEEHLKAAERERRRIEEESRQARAWLQRARQAAERADWNEAYGILERPPKVGNLPDEVGAEADELKERCTAQIADVALVSLGARTHSVRELAEEFIRNLIAEELSEFLAPALVQTDVEAEEFTSDNPSADGRAELLLRLSEPHRAGGDKPIGGPFDFQLNADPPRVCDEDGSLAGALVSDLTAVLRGLQKSRVETLCTPLRGGAFPRVKIEAQLDELTGRAVIAVDFTGSGSADATIKEEIAWEPSELRWEYVDPSGFAQRAGDIAAETVREPLASKLFEESEALRRYRPNLRLEVTPPAPMNADALSATLSLEARLTIRPGKKGDRRALATFPVVYPLVADASPDSCVETAETELSKLVVAAQTVARDDVVTDLRQRIERACVKTKLVVLPKRINTPTDEVTFSLKTKRHEPLTLTAAWDPKAFVYEPSNGWEDALADALAQVSSEGKIAKRRWPQLAAACAIAVVLVAVAGYALRGREGETDRIAEHQVKPIPTAHGEEDLSEDAGKTTPDEDDTSGTHGDGEPPPIDTDEPEDLDQNESPENEDRKVARDWLEELREANTAEQWARVTELHDAEPEIIHWPEGVRDEARLLVERAQSHQEASRVLADQDQAFRLVNTTATAIREIVTARGRPQLGELVTVNTTATPPQIRYELPGVEEPVRTVSVARLQSERQEFLAELAESVEELNGLLGDPESPEPEERQIEPTRLIAHLRDTGVHDFLDASRLRVRYRVSPDGWGLSDAKDRWVAAGVTAEVVFQPEGSENGALPSSVTLLPEVAQDLEVKNGVVTAICRQEQLGELARAAGARLLEHQNSALRQRRDRLAEELNSNGVTHETVRFDPLGELRPEVVLTVNAAGLQARALSVRWDRTRLAFGGPDRERLQEFIQAHRTIAQINSSGGSQDDRFGKVVEFSAPNARGQWVLAVAAPWVPADADAAELDASNRLLLQMGWPADASGIIENALRPRYRPLADAYDLVSGNPFFMNGSDADIPAGGSPGDDPVAKYIRTDGRFILPELTLLGEPKLIRTFEAGATTLEGTFAGRWGLRLDPDRPGGLDLEGIEPNNLRSVLREDPMPSVDRLIIRLELSEDAEPLVTNVGQALEAFAPTLGKVRALDERLAQWGERRELEATIRGLLDGQEAVNAGARAMGILRSIWQVKGARDVADADPLAYSSRLRGGIVWPKEQKADAQGIEVQRWIVPTVFAEYFCAPEFCYAVVWSVTADTEARINADGPRILELGRTGDLLASGVPEGNAPSDVGNRLFVRVLREAGNAVTNPHPHGVLGLVLALDDAMWWLNDRENKLSQLHLGVQRSRLRRLDQAGTGQPQWLRWNTLQNLRDLDKNKRRCDYVFVRALSDSKHAAGFSAPDGDEMWAIGALYSAHEGP